MGKRGAYTADTERATVLGTQGKKTVVYIECDTLPFVVGRAVRGNDMIERAKAGVLGRGNLTLHGAAFVTSPLGNFNPGEGKTRKGKTPSPYPFKLGVMVGYFFLFHLRGKLDNGNFAPSTDPHGCY